MALDAQNVRRHFPILNREILGNPLIYLDSAATAQKPKVVLDAMTKFYETSNGNAHRGMHILAEETTVAYENARKTVQKFVNAKRAEEIIFTKNCTESINLVAKSFTPVLGRGDAVIVSILEHHSNIVPWLQLKGREVEVHFVDCDEEGALNMKQLEDYLAQGNIKLVAMTAQSNVLGVRPDLEQIISKAHAAGALVVLDAAQAVAHQKIDVQELDCDFLAFSGHKLYGSNIGVLYGKRKLLEEMHPFLGGGGMIHEVTTEWYSAADIPLKFEAGSPHVAEAVGLAAAIDWLSQFSWSDIQAHEASLVAYAYEQLSSVKNVRILGPKDPTKMHGCISFVIEGMHPHDLTDYLGKKGICLRAGHHCTQPLHKKLGVTATTRLSVGIYNTKEDIDCVIAAL
jgi:cysteine desulfurase / selenocysteine lyase